MHEKNDLKEEKMYENKCKEETSCVIVQITEYHTILKRLKFHSRIIFSDE